MSLKNWRPGVLILDDGSALKGQMPFNAYASGEICFNTGMTGYQEAISDPSYTNQIIAFTFPHIGNVGFNRYDSENEAQPNQVKQGAKGMIIRNAITEASNFRSQGNFIEYARERNLAVICGLDTRSLTVKIRKKLISNCIISSYKDESEIESLARKAASLPSMAGMELTESASVKQFDEYCATGIKTVVVIDYGVKENILRILKQMNLRVIVAPSNATFEDIMQYKPAGVVLSNGPGDPRETLKIAGKTISLLAKEGVPLFGICLGHQLIAGLFGATLIKLPQGHRGVNHPVIHYATGKIEITPQNHGFACSDDRLPNFIKVTHRSLFDNVIEGLEIHENSIIKMPDFTFKAGKIFSVQYHPEGSAGPHDSRYLFDKFLSDLKDYSKT